NVSGKTIHIAGTFTPGTAAHNLANSTVDYDAAGAQNVALLNVLGPYFILSITGDRGGATVTLPAGDMRVTGNFNDSATNVVYSTTGNTIDLSGFVPQIIYAPPPFVFNGFNINNAVGVTANSDIAVNGNLSLNSGKLKMVP